MFRLIKDVAGYYRFPYNLMELFQYQNWKREITHRQQRKKRGWSNKDTWGGGEHILSVTSGILRELQHEQNPIDWEFYFEANYTEIKKYGYNSLIEVADDIDDYLWVQENSSTLDISTEALITLELEHHDRATNAMHFVADNHAMLWW